MRPKISKPQLHFLIQAHHDPRALSELVTALESKNIYLHIDKKSEQSEFTAALAEKEIHFVPDPIVVQWGGWSSVAAAIKLIKLARSKMSDGDYAILLSGDSYPIAKSDEISAFFAKNAGREFIECIDMADPIAGKGLFRLSMFYLEFDVRGNGFLHEVRRLRSRIGRRFIKRNWRKPFAELKPFGGSAWWALSSAALDLILESVQDKQELVRFARNTWIPDEYFLHTILANSYLAPRISTTPMFADFKNSAPNAAILNQTHIEQLRQIRASRDSALTSPTFLFARKANSDEIREAIRTELWTL